MNFIFRNSPDLNAHTLTNASGAPQDVLLSPTMSEGLIAKNVTGRTALHEAIKDAASVSVRETLATPDDDMGITSRRMRVLNKYAQDIIEHGLMRDAQVVCGVICEDAIDGVPIPEIMGKSNISSGFDKKGQLLAIYKNNPEVAEVIVRYNVVGFHASRSASLWGVLQHGLLSAAEVRRRGLNIGTGERTFSRKGGEDTIRFADWRAVGTIRRFSASSGPVTAATLRERAAEYRDSAETNKNRSYGDDPLTNNPAVYNLLAVAEDDEKVAEFIQENPDTEEAQLIMDNFPVAYGLCADGYEVYDHIIQLPKREGNYHTPQKVLSRTMISDDYGEFVVDSSEVSTQDIAIIAVPRARVDQVDALVVRFGLPTCVVAIEDLVDNPYLKYA